MQTYRHEANPEDERCARYAGNGLAIEIKQGSAYPSTLFRIERSDGGVFERELNWGHHGLAKFLTGYPFETVLDIGSENGVAANAFRFCGKRVTTIDSNSELGADRAGDYVTTDFGQTFDAIWCSHVFEHQRNPGLFADKLFDDLTDQGVLAVSVPSVLEVLIIAHANIFTTTHLIYNLILAGFDCSDAAVRQYDWQMTAIVRKKQNGVKRRVGIASVADGRYGTDTHCPDIFSYFPKDIRDQITPIGHGPGPVKRINWD